MIRLYKGGVESPLLHPTDARDWAANFGWSYEPSPTPAEVPESPTPEPEPEAEPLLPALEIINNATEPDELTPLPTIGLVSARTILDARPTTGYDSLEAVAALDGLSRVDWDAVEAWRQD